MAWYWWLIIGVLAANGFVILLIALALVVGRIRRDREAVDKEQTDAGTGKPA
jgi:uncharacterized membrane protein